MPDPTDLLRSLPGLVADDGPPAGDIEARGRRRRRRRHVALGALGLVLLVAGGAMALSRSDGDRDKVRAGPGTSVEPSSTSAPDRSTAAAGPAAELTLSPSGPVEPGATVSLVLADPPPDGTDVIITQCVSEVLDVDPRFASDWCGDYATQSWSDDQFVVARVLRTNSAGRVDCASTPGRCVVGVRVGGRAAVDDRWAPLTFVDGLPPVSDPTVETSPPVGGYPDGEVATFTVRGLQPQEQVTASQCPSALQSGGTGCESLASPTVVTAAPDGVAEIRIRLYHDVFVGYRGPGYVGCSPCELRVEPAGSKMPAPVAIEMTPIATPSRPQLRVEPPGPHAPGDTVTLVGSGFRPRDEPERIETERIGWCAAEPGGAGAASCVAPAGAGDIVVADDGSLRIDGFRLPGPDDEVLGVRCAERPGACVLGWQPDEGSDYAFAVPLDLTG